MNIYYPNVDIHNIMGTDIYSNKLAFHNKFFLNFFFTCSDDILLEQNTGNRRNKTYKIDVHFNLDIKHAPYARIMNA